jgi:hypothetical protein
VVTVASGACVVEYEGKRGRVYRVKFRDADGRQVQQTLGRERDGWTRQRAERELGKLLDKVERERWRKPTRERLSSLVDEYLEQYLPSRGRRRSTLLDYTNTLCRHVLPTLGDVELAELEARPELLDRYIATKREADLAAKTIANHFADAVGVVRVRVSPATDDRRPSASPRAAVGTDARHACPAGG